MFLVIGLSAPMVAMAQINPEQMQGNGERSAPVSQVQEYGNRAEVPHQISSGLGDVVVAPQPAGAESHDLLAQQITDESRSSLASQIISRFDRGATPSVDHITGTDRCDPINRSPDFQDRCSQFLEANPDKLSERDAGQLSPEKELLQDDRLFDASEQLESATQRLQSTGDPDGSLLAMGVASVVLGRVAAEATPEKKDDEPATDFAAQDLLNFLQLPPTP